MKRAIAIFSIAAILLLAVGCSALAGQTEFDIPDPAATPVTPAEPTEPAEPTTPAEPAEPTVPAERVVWEPLTVTDGTAKPTLTDGDGSIELVKLAYTAEDYENVTGITITANGKEYTETFEWSIYQTSCFAADTTVGDGFIEIYLYGDMASDDYETRVFRVSGDKLISASYFGTALGVDGNGVISMDETVDVLGTFGADCTCAIDDSFNIVRTSDYTIRPMEEYEYYSYPSTVRDALPCVNEATGEAMTLPTGASVRPAATDLATYVTCELKDGTRVRIAIAKDTENWGWLIDGVHETEWFDQLMYAG